MNNFAQNLRFLREKKEFTQQQLADLLDFNRSTLASYESGNSEPEIDKIIVIAEYFGIDLTDLISRDLANAHLMEESADYKKQSDAHLNAHLNAHLIGSKEGIPLIPVEAMAGMGNGDIQIFENEILKRYIVPEFTELGVTFIIQAKGSSMLPKYNSGDLLACKTVKDLNFFQWGKVYVLDTDQGALVKRLYPTENKDFVECRSDNTERYPPFQMPTASIRKIAIVVGVIRLE
ncbi:MAG: XRE family transcriptional regulator [Cytophagaceae bacterium]